MKKLLLSSIALLSVIGLTACGEKAKKLTAEEAKQKIEEVSKATEAAKVYNMKGSVDASLKGTISLGSGAVAINITPDITGKVNYESKLNETSSYTKTYAQATISGLDNLWTLPIMPKQVKSIYDAYAPMVAKGMTMEEYSVKDGNVVTWYEIVNGELNRCFTAGTIDPSEAEEDDVLPVEGEDDEMNYEDFINYGAFTLKGNTLTADASIVDVDKLIALLAEDDITVSKDAIKIEFKAFEIKLNKDNTIASANIDVSVAVKTAADMEGMAVNVDLTLGVKANLTCNYKSETITVPQKYVDAAKELDTDAE